MLNFLLAINDSLAAIGGLDVVEKSNDFFTGNRFFNADDFYQLLIRYAVDFLIAFVLIRLIYYPINKRKDYLFTFFLFNSLIFLMCFMLASSKAGLGFAFGLFAVFSILRYRTEMVPIKEMAYFFICITVAVINSLATKKISYVELAFANILIVALTYTLDSWMWRSLTNENVKEIMYERIDLITPEKREEMLNDLKARTGLPVHRIEILKIDFLRDVARIKAFYFAKENSSHIEETNDDGDDD